MCVVPQKWNTLLFFVYYTFQLCPQSWQTAILECFVTSFCFLCPNNFTNIIGIVKHIHNNGLHHQPINNQYKILWCLFFNCDSDTIWTFTFELPHLVQVIKYIPFLFIFYLKALLFSTLITSPNISMSSIFRPFWIGKFHIFIACNSISPLSVCIIFLMIGNPPFIFKR